MPPRHPALLLLFLGMLFLLPGCPAEPAGQLLELSLTAPRQAVSARTPDAPAPGRKRRRPAAIGDRGRRIEQYRQEHRSTGYTSWKRRLPFWPRKLLILAELALFIAGGVLAGQMLEVAGMIRRLAFITRPILWLGRLPAEAGPAFIMALQSGAVANTMLVGYRDEGKLSRRQLYTAVLVVSCLSLFAHLPTFIFPLAAAFGAEATIALFGVRFGAIAAEIVLVLLVSSLLIRRWWPDSLRAERPEDAVDLEHKSRRESGPFWPTVWKRSRRTMRRLLLYLLPSFLGMAALERVGAFKWLAREVPGLFTLSFLPPEAAAIIPGQALSLYNGAILAANAVDAGDITTKQAIVVLLFGSLVTAPIRTLKHAMPTYLAVLGARPGFVMAIAAQVLRCLFVLAATVILIVVWNV